MRVFSHFPVIAAVVAAVIVYIKDLRESIRGRT